MSDSSEGPANRLAGESSPYLLLHRHNPVDWYPWGAEALERARREDKPIFLSVGYSTCYWCHVMERESFSNPRIAAVMNRDFVNVKLDREERPDLDEIYMAATQILSGQGGWPNSLFLTPELKPFYAGTYFPPDERHGRPGFAGVLGDLAAAWRDRRREVEEQAEEMARAMGRFLEERARPAAEPAAAEIARRAAAALARRFDAEWGGFGGAPKFPTPSNLFLLAEMAPADGEAGAMLAATLDQMARGGIYDQLGGGFHRYATDREWKVPHFEKMLYDNGLLLEIYAREHARTGDRQAARVAAETAELLRREMTSSEGAFWSAIDAETHGHEGSYYVWTREEIEAAVGAEDAAFLAPLLGFGGPPFFEEDRYVLHLPEPLEVVARRRRLAPGELRQEVASLRARLLAARSQRERPATDDKVLADWNGTAIAGLATAGGLLPAPELTARAARAADFLLREMRPAGGPLLHTWRGGRARIDAYLADYAFLVRGLLALHEASGEERWLEAAAELTREQIARLRDPAGGFYVAAASPDVLFRSKDPFDGAMPSANAIAALNLLDLAQRTGDPAWLEEARDTLKAFASLLEAHPDAVRMMAIANLRYHRLAAAGVAAAGGARREPGGRASFPRAEEERSALFAEEDRPALAALEREAASRVEVRLELGEAVAPESPEPTEIPRGAAGERGPAGAAEGFDEGQAAGSREARGEWQADGSREVRGAPAASHHESGVPKPVWRRFRLVLDIAPGWHIQAHSTGDPLLVATALEAAAPQGMAEEEVPAGAANAQAATDTGAGMWTELRKVIYPGEPPPAVYAGRVEITGEVRAAPAGGRLRLIYQACDEGRCLPRVEREIPIE